MYICVMKKAFQALALALAALTALPIPMAAQNRYGGIVEFESIVHDFGTVQADGGPVDCSFRIRNISSGPLAITAVVPQCGCTDVKWTRSDINPGAYGRIDVSYQNEDGPYPFDKTVTVHVSGLKKPVVLHLRGVAVAKSEPLDKSYPVHYGPMAVRSSCIQAANLSQGERRSGEVAVANIGKTPIKITFKDVSEGLDISVGDATLAPGAVTRIVYTITADRSRWGKNTYYATPVINGKVYRSSGKEALQTPLMGAEAVMQDADQKLAEGCTLLGFTAVTKENFSSLSRKEINEGPNPYFDESTFLYGKIKAGATIPVRFKFTNKGKKELKIYKIDCECSRVTGPAAVSPVAPGASALIDFKLDTAGLSRGEHMFIVTLYTNSALRPIINLYITGIVQ